jgi:hypothetical protein
VYIKALFDDKENFMTRMSKQGKRRAMSPRRPNPHTVKTGSLKDNLPKGFKEHKNAVEGENSKRVFIPSVIK